MKPELIDVAARLIAIGLVTLALTTPPPCSSCSAPPHRRTATDNSPVAWILSACVLLWFATSWLVLPPIVLRRTEARRRRYPRPGPATLRLRQQRPQRPERRPLTVAEQLEGWADQAISRVTIKAGESRGRVGQP